jgi:hypothetical protein
MKMRLHTFASLSVNSATSTQNHLYTCRDGVFHVLVRLQLFVYGQASSRLLRPLLIASHERTPRKDEIMHTLPSLRAQRSNLHHCSQVPQPDTLATLTWIQAKRSYNRSLLSNN